jgi:putative aldouronate transport system substrate-binding protein
LAIASRQLPDVFKVNGTQFKQLLDADFLADITDYTENNLSQTIKKIFEHAPGVTNSAKRNNRLYGVPMFGYGPIVMPYPLYIRHDWGEAAKAAGIAIPPKTIQELEALMQYFMKNHPGTLGMPLDKSLTEFYMFSPAFGAYPNIWIKDSAGKLAYGRIQPEMKEALGVFADWYSKGYFKKDFMSDTGDTVHQDMVSGKYGVEVFYHWQGYYRGADTVKNLGYEAYADAYEIPSATGKPVLHQGSFDNGGYLVVNKNCKNIDAALKCMSFILYIYDDVLEQKIMTLDERKPYTLYGNDGFIT